jgi:alkanesulfonate monooxygenase SsuD/methylene tetrahydromethanopterin reductase-like flavin-dependent oxidoreductase (luciferase family)
VRVGLYLDMRGSPSGSWAGSYAATLARVADAEAAGIGAVWLTEHHGFADGYLPQPLTFAAALAARTTRVRIGTAVVIAPFVHPLALAEQAAVVDNLSGGRLELGLGAGWRAEEFSAWGVDHRQRYQALEERAGGLRAAWASGRATPAPVQDPLPLWIGARGPRGAELAGRLGAGLLWLDPLLLTPYLAGLSASGHGAGMARMGGLVNVFLADDPDAVSAQLREAGRSNKQSYGDRPGARSGPLLGLEVLTVAAAVRKAREQTDGLPVTDIFCFERIGGVAGDLVDRHAELLAGPFATALRSSGDQIVGETSPRGGTGG